MKSPGIFAFVFLAYSIALLHTAIPHHHAEDGRTGISTIHCVSTASMGGLLEMVFSTDLGKGHLETFRKSVAADNAQQLAAAVFSLGFLFTLLIFAFAPVRIRKTVSRHIEILHKRRILFSSASFRAPPALA